MSTMTDQEYYENPDNWGNAQYLSLKDVLDNILIVPNDDSYFKHAKRPTARIFGKRAIKMLNVDVKSENKAISIDVPPSKIFPFPRYMTNWSRISVINSCGRLQELIINNSPTISDYLQDHDSELMYDCNGSILEGDSFNAEQGDCCYEIEPCVEDDCNCGCDDTKFDASWVKENKAGNYFEFSDDLVDESVVIEFQCAGLDALDDCDIKIDNRLEMTITRYIEWNLLLGQRNVPLSTAREYERFYKAEKTRSEKLLGNKISLNQIIKSVSLRY